MKERPPALCSAVFRMKAQTTKDGRVVLFRPTLNSERMNRTALGY